MIIDEKILFNELIQKYGFYIEEQKSSGFRMWIAVKNVEDGLYCVAVCDKKDYSKALEYGNKYLINKNVKYSLNIVVLTSSQMDIDHLINRRGIIYDTSNDVIVYSSQECEPIRKIINSIVERKRSTKKVSKKGVIKKNKMFSTTGILISINIIMFIISVILSRSIIDIRVDVLVLLGAKVNYLISHGQIYRLLTCMFLHGGIVHLFFNMYSLYCLGDLIEDVFGRKNYLIIYFVSGLSSSILSYMISPSISIGASGAIFGLLGAALIIGIKEKNRIGNQFVTNIIMVIVMNIFIGLSNSGIDNAAHFGGLIGGVIISYIIIRLRKNKVFAS